jgi:hypothetical protein
MRRRTWASPICAGFCRRTGEALASLFMKPVRPERAAEARNWYECANLEDGARESGTRSLFGISLTSVDGSAAWALIRFFWPHALRAGWRDIYLGSPLPGLARALRDEPALEPASYAARTRGGLPADPQLRYYHQRGFTQLVAVRPEYFPHAASLDHGAVLRGVIPLSNLWTLWRRMPLSTLQAMSGLAAGCWTAGTRGDEPVVTGTAMPCARLFDGLLPLRPPVRVLDPAVQDWSDAHPAADPQLRAEAARCAKRVAPASPLPQRRARPIRARRRSSTAHRQCRSRAGWLGLTMRLARPSVRAAHGAAVGRCCAAMRKTGESNREARRWHCAEEIGHRHVTTDLLRSARPAPGRARRRPASAHLAGDAVS